MSLGTFIGACLGAAAMQCGRDYKAWKKRRAMLPPEKRNAGWLITDRNLRIFERTVRTLIVFAILFAIASVIFSIHLFNEMVRQNITDVRDLR